MQARCFLVDGRKPGGLARQAAARIHRRFGHLDRGQRSIAESGGLAPGRCAFGHAEQIRLGLGNAVHRRGVFRCIERAFDQPAPDADQFAQQRQIVNLLCQLARGEQAGAAGGQLRQIGRAAQVFQRLVRFEIGTQGDRRGGGVAFDQHQHAFVNAGVQGFEEMFWPDRHRQFLDHPVIDQHRAQKRRFGFEIIGQFARRRVAFAGGRVDSGDFCRFVHHRLMRPPRPFAQGWNAPIFIFRAVDSGES